MATRTATPRTQEERQARSDAAMVSAAVALICERGPAATTLTDVGVRAGYSRGLAGYRFGSKAGLWAFLIHTIGEEWLAELARATRARRGLAAVDAALAAHAAMLEASPQRIRAFYMLWFDSVGPDPDLRAQIARVHARRRHDVARWLRDGIADGTVDAGADVASAAERFVSQIVGIVYGWLVDGTPRRVAAQHADLAREMARALTPRPPEES